MSFLTRLFWWAVLLACLLIVVLFPGPFDRLFKSFRGDAETQYDDYA